jgi:hypothetical protein
LLGNHSLELPKGVLAAVGHVEESIIILVLLVDCRHQGSCKQITNRNSDENIGRCSKIHELDTSLFREARLLHLLSIPVGGSVSFTKMKIAFSAPSLIRFRTTYINCPTVRSAGTRYLYGGDGYQHIKQYEVNKGGPDMIVL